MTSPRYLQAFEREATELPADDWTSHRDLAQKAVEYGYAVELTQTYEAGARTEIPLTHSLRFLSPVDIDAFDENLDEQESLKGSVSVEQFTPEHPHGFYGRRTPVELSPDAKNGPGEWRVWVSHGGWQSVHSTLPQALETVLHEQSDLAWVEPKHHAAFTSDGLVRADNDSPLPLNVDGSCSVEHVLDAFRVAATADGEHITVAVGRDNVGSVFNASFKPDGGWILVGCDATTRHEVEGIGQINVGQAAGEILDIFAAFGEGAGHLSQGVERKLFWRRDVELRPDW